MVLNTFPQPGKAHLKLSVSQNIVTNYNVFGMLFNFMQATFKIRNHS